MASVRSEALEDKQRGAPPARRRKVSPYRVASVITWAFSVSLTAAFLMSLKRPLDPLLAIPIALAIQAVCTLAERPMWRWVLRRPGGRLLLVGIGISTIDAILNAGGLYPYMGGLGSSNVATMLAEVLQTSPEVGPRVAFTLALALGFIVAGLPEMLWELDETKGT